MTPAHARADVSPATQQPIAGSANCNLCGNTGTDWSATYQDHANRTISYRLLRCSQCGLVYVHPKPGAAELASRSGHYQKLLSDMRGKVENSTIGRIGIRMMRKGRTPEGFGPGHRLLDIGCATGDYLAFLRGLGWETQGIEFDPDAASQARETLGLNVITGMAESALLKLPDRHFDVVTMWHVLEHVNDPRAVLTEIRRVLKPEGKLLIEVPNYQSIWSTLLRGDWFPLEYPYHQHHFTPRTLRRMLNETGFRVSGMVGQAAPAETTWSLHMLWHRWLGRQWNGRLLWSPAGVVALYPLEMLLAALNRTNHLQATAAPL